MAQQPLTDTLQETLSLFDVGGAPLATSEVADRVGLGRRSAYERLERLVDHGCLETKKVGSSGRVWWRKASSTARADVDWPAAATSLVDDVLDGADVGVFVLDGTNEVRWINAATERYFGLDRERVIGADKRRLVEETIAETVDDGAAFTETVVSLYEGDAGREEFECRVTAGEGREERWLEHRSEPIESGAFAGGRVELYYDVTERKRTQLELAEEHRQFESLVTAVEEYAICKLDPDGHVETWNTGAEQIKGYDADEILGEHVETFYTAADREAGVPEQTLATAAEQGTVEAEGWRVAADGSRFWATVTITAIRDDDGELEGYAKVTRDMTERREREQALRRERDLTARLFETAPVRLAIFDTDGSLDRMNSEGREMFGLEADEGSDFDLTDYQFYDEDGTPLDTADHPARTVLSTGEPVSERLVGHDTPADDRRWVRVSAAPLVDDSGALERVVVAGEDVTELKRTAHQLERRRDELEDELREVFDRIDDAFFALDDDWRITHVNEQTTRLVDRPVSDILGRNIWEAFEAATDTNVQRNYERAMETQEPVTFETYYPPLESWFEVNAYPSASGLSVYFRDVTERRERERELEQYERAVETIGDGVYVVDEDREFVLVNDAYCHLTGYDREALLGSHVSVVAPEDGLDRGDALRAELLESDETVGTLEAELATADGGTVPIEARFALFDRGDEGYGSVGVVRDVTERRKRERELRRYESIVETVEDGIYTVSEDGVFTFVNDAHKEMIGFPSTELVGRKAGWLVESGVLDPDVIAQAREMDARLRAGECESSSIEATLSRPDGSTVETEATFNTLTTDGGHERVGVVRDVTDRVERERELERQREQLAALNSLNEAVREVTAAVIEQSTREEIEAAVCTYLADSASYLFAWVGEVDAHAETVSVRTEAGAAGYLDDIVVSVDPDDEYGDGPAGRAFRTGEIQTVSTVSDDQYGPWRDHGAAHDVESAAAIPIGHDGTVYGTLNVYADRQNAFEGQEQAVIAQLGDIVGHAIAAAERKQALLSDEVVELQLVVPDVFAAAMDGEELPGRAQLDHTISVGDGEFIIYGSATDDAVGWLRTLVDAVPPWEALTVHGVSDGEATFELRLTDPPMLSAIASVGGAVERAVIEDGDYRMTVHVPTSVAVRQVVDPIERAYPSVQLRRREQMTKTRDPADRMGAELLADLTDRQRTALETAYHAGFFEWPRAASGEQVASSLSIAPPTFHQHLRKAELAVFQQVFRSGTTDA
ncbi:PAS domain S-box protein [Haloarcula onubensis]|uniref:PAS domain S-box protein n=1 Tax=Haloarcula onubensis TaxID=2950539 RepID=A0ABU2FRJ0_9EURY|nr:PAS domain S-box protein [Halomicroarcula sp. S3CR25-11]MDS0282771.1 PAS domain S-box protein [Halomicroarcula sp. S3CR25-11]